METNVRLSGLIELTPERVEQLPDGPGVFALVSAGQKVVYVDHAGEDAGLREKVREIAEEHVLSVAQFFRYAATEDVEAARRIADRLIAGHRPPHNVGYDRFRNSDVQPSKQGHSVRRAMPNP